MDKIMTSPIVGVVMCSNLLHGHSSQTVQQKYLQAICNAGGIPLALPHMIIEQPHWLEQLLSCLDGILLPGSPSNIQPHWYGVEGDEQYSDPSRDRLSMALIHFTVQHQIPILAICRGFQELNVAMGGTLHRKLYEQPDLLEHREDPSVSLVQQYALRHTATLQPEGMLAQFFPNQSTLSVNSLHGQGICTLGERLQVEAVADDGLIEAVSVIGHPFAIGVQWHPEWPNTQDNLSQQLFTHFTEACRIYRANLVAKGKEYEHQ